MSNPALPDNDPIEVLESAVLSKEARGWVVVTQEPAPEADDADDAGTWELTNDDD
jgi:hypothetical protein